ncbi:MAG TPA: hypothetical protein DD473_26165 [Planctomycetaceae bacterium]|nr:hypothetical protein [Planctomycetaceae bacterium]
MIDNSPEFAIDFIHKKQKSWGFCKFSLKFLECWLIVEYSDHSSESNKQLGTVRNLSKWKWRNWLYVNR